MESKDDINIKTEPLDYDVDGSDSASGKMASVTGFHPTLASEKFIKTQVEEYEEEEKIDIKYESLDYGIKRPVIENPNEYAEKQFECHKDSYKSRDNYTLRKHILSIHEKEKAPQHSCEICSFRSVYKWSLKKHMRIHTEFSLECTLCQKSFKYKNSLDSHYVSIHRDQSDSFKHLLTNKVNQCSKCSYITGDTSSFKRHLLTHEDDQNKFKFECYTCGYKCVQKSALVAHIRIHADTDKLPFACSECNKRFNSKSGLDAHIVSRHQENEKLMKTVTNKIHQCLRCSFNTVKLCNFKRHIKYCNNK